MAVLASLIGPSKDVKRHLTKAQCLQVQLWALQFVIPDLTARLLGVRNECHSILTDRYLV
jgi:hypothetical protein